jgi:hypothetical protein
MSKTDKLNGIGYVIGGFSKAEGPGGVTVEGETYSGKPYQTVEEAVAEIDANGGPASDSTIFVGVVFPFALVVQPDWDDATIQALGEEIEQKLSGFMNTYDGPMVYEAGKGSATPNADLNFKDGALD